jgi:hypothetical protein
LAPHLITGMGLAVTQFNDRKIDPAHTVDLDGGVSPTGEHALLQLQRRHQAYLGFTFLTNPYGLLFSGANEPRLRRSALATLAAGASPRGRP